MSSLSASTRHLFATSLLCLSPAALLAADIVPVAQERSVWSFIINPRCNPASASRTINAPDFAPFHAESAFEFDCADSLAAAAGRQQSEINPAAILALGTARSEAASAINDVIHAFASSELDVTFSIAEATQFALTGEIRAFKAGPLGQFASADVSLRGPGDVVLLSFQVSAPEDESVLSQALDSAGPLPAGTYRLIANARTFIDSMVPPNGGSESAFTLRFGLPQRCPSDLNGDGQTDLPDLAMLLSEFGCSGAACLSDINDDDETGLADLAALLAEFGSTCP